MWAVMAGDVAVSGDSSGGMELKPADVSALTTAAEAFKAVLAWHGYVASSEANSSVGSTCVSTSPESAHKVWRSSCGFCRAKCVLALGSITRAVAPPPARAHSRDVCGSCSDATSAFCLEGVQRWSLVVCADSFVGISRSTRHPLYPLSPNV